MMEPVEEILSWQTHISQRACAMQGHVGMMAKRTGGSKVQWAAGLSKESIFSLQSFKVVRLPNTCSI